MPLAGNVLRHKKMAAHIRALRFNQEYGACALASDVSLHSLPSFNVLALHRLLRVCHGRWSSRV